MQGKITAARREAEGLKDRIKRKKDELGDTSCKLLENFCLCPTVCKVCRFVRNNLI